MHLVFRHKKWLVGPPLLREMLGQIDSPPSKNAHLQSIFARRASAVTPSEKSLIITNRKSITGFPMSLR